MTAEKFTKKRDARAKLLFCQFKPIAFLPFSLPSPSSLLKLPIAYITGQGPVSRIEGINSTGFDFKVCLRARKVTGPLSGTRLIPSTF